MIPVRKKNWERIALRLEQGVDVGVTRGKRLEGASARSFGKDFYWPTDRIVVISAEMGMVPVEAVLILQFEAISEIAARRNRVLRWTLARQKVYIQDEAAHLTCVTPGTPSMCGVPR